MIAKLYARIRRFLAKADEKDLPSAGVWSSRIREGALLICQEKQGLLLDVGCGEGLFLRGLDKRKIAGYGIDINIKQLETCCKNPGLGGCLAAGSAFALPFKPETFDVFVCINTFYNMKSLKQIKAILRQIYICGKKDSCLIFDLRNSANPVLRLKYKLAPLYDETIRKTGLPLSVFSLPEIEAVLKEEKFSLVRKKFLGFPQNRFSPIIMIEAKKC